MQFMNLAHIQLDCSMLQGSPITQPKAY